MTLTELRAIAEAATTGPWRISRGLELIAAYPSRSPNSVVSLLWPDETGDTVMGNMDDLKFIARFDPPMIKKLLAVVEAAQESCRNAALVCDQDVALEYALEELENHK